MDVSEAFTVQGVLWLASRALLDAGSGLVGLPPVYTKLMDSEGEWAAYINEDVDELHRRVQGPGL